MAWKLISSCVKPITEKLATDFMSMEAVPQERCVSERRLAVYEKSVRSGQWRPCTWAKAECIETGALYRINGQHTSRLFAGGLAKEFPGHYAILENYECDTLEDVGRLYGSFDAAISSRTTSDINRAFASSVPELAGIPRKIIDGCASGIALHKAGGLSPSVQGTTPCERAEFLLEYPDFVIWVYKIVSDTNKYRYLCRQGPVAAMFGSWQKCKKDAEAFWNLVRTEEGSKPTCPDRALSKWLQTTSVTFHGDSIASKKANSREFYVRCIHCWNAWRKNEELKIIKYHANAKTPAFV